MFVTMYTSRILIVCVLMVVVGGYGVQASTRVDTDTSSTVAHSRG